MIGENHLLLDEPTASLDIRHQITAMKTMVNLSRRDIGVVVVLHDLNLASTFADKIALLEGGRIISMGKPAETFKNEYLTQAYGVKFEIAKTSANGMRISPIYNN